MEQSMSHSSACSSQPSKSRCTAATPPPNISPWVSPRPSSRTKSVDQGKCEISIQEMRGRLEWWESGEVKSFPGGGMSGQATGAGGGLRMGEGGGGLRMGEAGGGLNMGEAGGGLNMGEAGGGLRIGKEGGGLSMGEAGGGPNMGDGGGGLNMGEAGGEREGTVHVPQLSLQ
eukprot:jgi/Botrbrau1/1440/Bobra.0063s0131.1